MDEDKKQKNSVTFFWRSKTKRPKKKKNTHKHQRLFNAGLSGSFAGARISNAK